jgi:hypothetical protein
MDNNTIQYQPRTETITDWDVLARLPELIDEDSLTYEQYRTLHEFEILYKRLSRVETKEETDRIRKEIADLEKEKAYIIHGLVQMGRLIIEAQNRERDRIIYENYLRRKSEPTLKPAVAVKSENVLETAQKHDEAIKQKEKEQAEKAKQETRQMENKNFDKAFNYILLTTVLKVASLSIALFMLDVPLFVTLLISTFMYLPAFKPSVVTAFIVEHTYNFARPILYIVATIIAAGGDQNFFTIAFYILAGIQAIYMIPRFIYTITTILDLIKSKF